MENSSSDSLNHDTSSSSSIEIIDVPKICPPLIDIANSDSDSSNAKDETCSSIGGDSPSEEIQHSRSKYSLNSIELCDLNFISCSQKITNEKKSKITVCKTNLTKKRNFTIKSENKSTISEVPHPNTTRIFKSKPCPKVHARKTKSNIADFKANVTKKEKYASEPAKKENGNRIFCKSKVPQVCQHSSIHLSFPEKNYSKSGASEKLSRATNIHKIESPKYPVSANLSKSLITTNQSNNVILGMDNCRNKYSSSKYSEREKKKMAKSEKNISGKAKNISKFQTEKCSKNRSVLQNCDNNMSTPEAEDRSNNVSEINRTQDHPFYPESRLGLNRILHTHGRKLKEFKNKRDSHKKCREKKSFQKEKLKGTDLNVNKNQNHKKSSFRVGNEHEGDSLTEASDSKLDLQKLGIPKIQKISIHPSRTSMQSKNEQKKDAKQFKNKGNNSLTENATKIHKFKNNSKSISNHSQTHKLSSDIRNKSKHKMCSETVKTRSEARELSSSARALEFTETKYSINSSRNPSVVQYQPTKQLESNESKKCKKIKMYLSQQNAQKSSAE